MNRTIFSMGPVVLALGFLVGSTALNAQVSHITSRPTVQTQMEVRGSVESTQARTIARLAKALPNFWASTEAGKAYMILDTMVRRSIDGRVMWVEQGRSTPFAQDVTPEQLVQTAPGFVELLLGQYATQERIALSQLDAALSNYFDTTRPGQGTGLSGGQLMRNSDRSATFTDGVIVFVLDETTPALTVASMAPALAASFTNLAGAIVPVEVRAGYALRDPANTNQLINHDGRTYDTAGNALPPANPEVVAKLFGNKKSN